MQPPPAMWSDEQPPVIVIDAETDEWTGRHTDVQIYTVFLFCL